MARSDSPPLRSIRRTTVVALALGFVACGGPATSPIESPTAAPNQIPVGFGTASLSWTPVTADTSGMPLADLAGYKIYYGMSPGDLNNPPILVPDPSATAYLVANLPSGTWYFTVAAYTAGGVDGVRSNVASKTIP